MSDTADTTTATTTAADTTTAATAATTTPDTGAAATTTAADDASLLAKPGATTTTPAADEFAFLPEKYRVMGEDGKLDLAASSRKLGEGYGALAKKLGTGEVPPETPDAYTFTPPEEFKDVPLDENLSKGFRERAHKVGLNQQQFEFVMGEYFGMVPQVLNAAASLTASEAKAQLSKVWSTEAEFQAGIAAADRAVSSAGEISEALWTKFGRDPDFIRFAASMGKEMREDTTPNDASGAAAADVGSLIASEAYRNPKHPEHAKVSEQVRRHFLATAGAASVGL